MRGKRQCSVGFSVSFEGGCRWRLFASGPSLGHAPDELRLRRSDFLRWHTGDCKKNGALKELRMSKDGLKIVRCSIWRPFLNVDVKVRS